MNEQRTPQQEMADLMSLVEDRTTHSNMRRSGLSLALGLGMGPNAFAEPRVKRQPQRNYFPQSNPNHRANKSKKKKRKAAQASKRRNRR